MRSSHDFFAEEAQRALCRSARPKARCSPHIPSVSPINRPSAASGFALAERLGAGLPVRATSLSNGCSQSCAVHVLGSAALSAGAELPKATSSTALLV
jgi:hypothetical protein